VGVCVCVFVCICVCCDIAGASINHTIDKIHQIVLHNSGWSERRELAVLNSVQRLGTTAAAWRKAAEQLARKVSTTVTASSRC
jgi:hypothetical protein